MRKWFNILKKVFLRANTAEFYYHQELKNFQEQEEQRRSQYLSVFSKVA